MKKFISVLAAFVCISFLSYADDDYAIQFAHLPAVSQTFVQTHFAGIQVSYCMRDAHSFEVRFNDGAEVEFDYVGNWKEVDCKYKAVPSSVLKLIPAEIQTYVENTFPQTLITKVNVKNWGYELELSNGFDAEFDKSGRFLRIDD